MAGIFLGLGTNLGNRKKNFSQTLNELSSNCDITILKLSSVYRSEPFGVTNQPWFYNMVIEINTQLSPVNLLNVTKDIEKEIGRKKTTRWGPRIIDIDILPNRGHDCLSYVGVAREIQALENKPLNNAEKSLSELKIEATIEATIETSMCPRYIGVKLEGIQIKESVCTGFPP